MEQKRKTGLRFKRITLSISGMMASTREYEVLKTVLGMEASVYDGPWQFNKMVSRRSCLEASERYNRQAYEALCEKFERLGVRKWNGFSESDPDVCDGNMFSLDIELEDGSFISAHGSNAYPDNYHDFENCLYKLAHGEKTE